MISGYNNDYNQKQCPEYSIKNLGRDNIGRKVVPLMDVESKFFPLHIDHPEYVISPRRFGEPVNGLIDTDPSYKNGAIFEEISWESDIFTPLGSFFAALRIR